MTEFQRQQGPANCLAQPELADCIDLLFCLATLFRSFVHVLATLYSLLSVTSISQLAMINQSVTAALAARDATRNGKDSHTSGTGVRRNERFVQECTYQDFMKYQPIYFKGTEGVVELTQWFERMETVFHISNCSIENQIKFSTCTLLAGALTWWNSHVMTVAHDVAYAMTWTDLKKKMTDKYCLRNEMKKLEAELWNLKVKGTDVLGYNQRFQELSLLCVRMFSEESDKIERYVGGLPDMIHSSVVASMPKTMQEAIEMATELMDRRISTFAERQAESNRKLEDTSRNNQNQQQPSKRQNVARVYIAGPGDKKQYGGTKPLCTKVPANTNNQGGNGAGQKPTCYECGVQGHFKRECPKLNVTFLILRSNNKGADEEIPDGGAPRVIVYGYDGLLMQPVDPPSPYYVPGPKQPPSPDYVPGPEHPLSPIEIPYVPEPEYPKYLVPSEDEAPMEDQPLPADASPVALSPGYVLDFDLEEDPEEDFEEDHADYPADGGDGDDEPSGDDSDDDDDEEEPFEDEEEEEHLASADFSAIPVVDPVPSAGDTEAFETDESAPIPRPPQIRIPFAQTRLRKARKTVRPKPPMSASIEARIAEHAAVPTPPLPVTSLPLPLPSPFTTSPTDAGAPLGYRAAGIRMRAVVASPPSLLPSTSYKTDVPEVEMPPRKKASAARQPRPTPEVDTWDEIVEAMMEIAPTTLEGVDQRVTELDTTVRQRTEEDRPYHRHTALALDREAVYARIAWTSSEERIAAIEAHVRTLEVQVATLITQTTSLQTRLTSALGRIATLEARDPEPQDGPAEAGSSC
ncbi:putative reverse transcriptase domain-containing protein [Tanacetum coccineum]|uniref:Reverse transcriptase domain-containing protein n=1 Tax=Tanacetum coccineum TaxID=301880 RepID=A0ABQ5INL0_9ASTR